MPNRTLERTRLTTPLSSMVLDGVPSPVPWSWASPRESAEFPTSVKEVLAIFAFPACLDMARDMQRIVAEWTSDAQSLACFPVELVCESIALVQRIEARRATPRYDA